MTPAEETNERNACDEWFHEKGGASIQDAWCERARRAPRWQPIETAPTTGRTLLLGYLNRAGNWRTVRGQWMSENYIAEYWEDPDDAEPGWFETAEEAEDVPNCWRIEPSHWMPLPEAPKEPS